MKGIIGISTGYKHIFSGTPLYNNHIMKKLISGYCFSRSQIAKYRLDVIEFYDKHGTKATIDAFKVSRRSIFRWRKMFIKSKRCLDSLIPDSTIPKRKRVMNTDSRIISFIKQIRVDHPHLGKEKIKPLLDRYCKQEQILTISESTIGKIIIRHKLIRPKRYGRYYHNPNSIRAQKGVRYKLKVKRSPKPSEFGYVEIDTIVKFVDGMKLYIFNAVDIKLKFEYACAYSKLNSTNGEDFLSRLTAVYPVQSGINIVQTDNGLEFMGSFDKYLKDRQIKHLFIYPRCPKINSFVERSNRSLQEEFVNDNLHYAVNNIGYFNRKLIDYLIWYNTQRVHKSLNNKSPIDYLLSVSPECQMSTTYTNY
jgi:transposase InsO family protein